MGIGQVFTRDYWIDSGQVKKDDKAAHEKNFDTTVQQSLCQRLTGFTNVSWQCKEGRRGATPTNRGSPRLSSPGVCESKGPRGSDIDAAGSGIGARASFERCLLEDFLGLEPGERIWLMISDKSEWYEPYLRALGSDAASASFERGHGQRFIELEGVVKSNPKGRETLEQVPRSDARAKQLYTEGEGITMDFDQISGGAQVMWKHVANPGLVEVWRWKPPGTRRDFLKALGPNLRCVAGVFSRRATRLLNEVEGDAIQTAEVLLAITRLRLRIARREIVRLEADKKKIACKSLSIADVRAAFRSEQNSDAGRAVLETVNDVYGEAMTGNFRTWASPNEPLVSSAMVQGLQGKIAVALPLMDTCLRILFMSEDMDRNRHADEMEAKELRMFEAFCAATGGRNKYLMLNLRLMESFSLRGRG